VVRRQTAATFWNFDRSTAFLEVAHALRAEGLMCRWRSPMDSIFYIIGVVVVVLFVVGFVRRRA